MKPSATHTSPRSQGAAQLAAVAEDRGLSLRDLAQLTNHRSAESPRNWLRGVKTPARPAREAIERALGVPVASWDLAEDVTPATAPRTEDFSAPHPASAATVVNITTVEPPTPRRTSTLDDVLALLAELERLASDSQLTPGERAKSIDSRGRLIALRARLERAEELREDHYVKNHPAFRRFCDRLIEALTPFPEAALAVHRALQEDT